ncbi:MAG: ComEC/Rec2 family competence protein [Saprospiraceae bacterium]|nr:ComEC/Rec2 family competence protein [Saprospiraceae bacterium]
MSIPLINWREAPFLRLLLPFVAGILSAAWLPYSANAAMGVAVGILPGLVVLLWLSYRRLPYSQRWIFGAILGLALAGLGYLLGSLSDERRAKDHFSAQLLEQNLISAEVLQIQPRGERLRLQLKLKAIGTTSAGMQSTRGRLLAHLPVDAAAGKIGIGDHLLIRAAVAPVPGPKNPKAFDYRRFLHNKNIHYQCFVQENDWRLQSRTSERAFARLTYAARQYCIGVLRQHLPTANEFGAGSALILGYRDETPGELRDAYAATGATHVLAVSGLHVGIVQMVITFLLQFWGGKGRERRVWKMGITLLGVWGFTLLTGAPSSALRAATMFSFLTVGRALRRPANVYNTIAAAAFLCCAYSPASFLMWGFNYRIWR